MSDHIPDATKMISDTPRTDDRTIYNEYGEWVNSSFARLLERELNAANERIKRLEEAGDAMVETTTTPAAEAWNKAKEAKAVSEYEHNEHLLDEIDRLRESNFHLRKGCEELKHRITQLERENDAMRADLLLWENGGPLP
jgi:predicted  nucleic acid-binding Zn-ribbon protein